jgi:hypothetical protein
MDAMVVSASYDCTMDDKILFPLYVCLDDGEVIAIEGFERILYHLEAIDIENDEYMFWDAAGRGLKVIIKKGKVSDFEKIDNTLTLQQAFEGYARQLTQRGVTVETSGTPEEIWAKIQKAKETLQSNPGFLSRLFRSKTK